MKKLDRYRLRMIFEKDIEKNFVVSKVRGNPFEIKAINSNISFNVFLKNISPAYFTNSPDITRIQVARIPAFQKIKDRNELCIPIGYDYLNSSYVIWDYSKFLRRINQKRNISIYSRLSEQKECKHKEYNSFFLSNGELVYSVDSKYISTFLSRINDFFAKHELEENPLGNYFNDKEIIERILFYLEENKQLKALEIFMNAEKKDGTAISLSQASIILNKLQK